MFNIDNTSETPLYMQIVDQTKIAIAKGFLKNGDRFPSVRDLSKTLLINQTTVSKAFKELDRQGIIESKPGIGTRIKLDTEKIDLEREDFLKRLEDDLRQAVFLKVTKDEIISLYDRVRRQIDDTKGD